jgi:RNA polymerase sigma-70 factor (ECF subfamily)
MKLDPTSASIVPPPRMSAAVSDPADEDAIDVALMARAATGEHAAFEELIERHQNAVVGTVAKMLGNPSDAQDIAQQVFLRLWKSAKRYQPTAKFTTYLFTITRNLVFNESRRRSRRREVSADERGQDSHHELEDTGTARPDNDLLQSELQAAVDRAIGDLPENQRLAVVLRRYENMPYEEIADVLGLSVSAVKSQLFRARGTLRESLSKYLDS